MDQTSINFVEIITSIFVLGGVIRTFIMDRDKTRTEQASTIANISYNLVQSTQAELTAARQQLAEFGKRVADLEAADVVEKAQIAKLEITIKEINERETYLLRLLGLTNDEIDNYRTGALTAENAREIVVKRITDVHTA